MLCLLNGIWNYIWPTMCSWWILCIFGGVWPFGRLTKQVFPQNMLILNSWCYTHIYIPSSLHCRSLDFSYDKNIWCRSSYLLTVSSTGISWSFWISWPTLCQAWVADRSVFRCCRLEGAKMMKMGHVDATSRNQAHRYVLYDCICQQGRPS